MKGSSGSQVHVRERERGWAGGWADGVVGWWRRWVTLLVVWVLRDANEFFRLDWINVAAYCWFFAAAENALVWLGLQTTARLHVVVVIAAAE